jgi:hypothetical protein
MMPSMRLAVGTVVAALALALPAAAATGRTTATHGAWRAALTFVHKGAGPAAYADLRLRITDGGAAVLDAPVRSRLRGVAYLEPGYGTVLAFRDLDGDGTPELLLSLYTGGAHCCFVDQVFDLRRPSPKRVEISFADAGARLLRVGGQTLFRSADEAFAYEFTDYADSGAPIQIWSYARGRFVDVTRAHRGLVAADAASWWKGVQGRVRHRGDVRGLVAAWAADQALLGRAARARRAVAGLAARGAFEHGFGTPKGSAYVAALWRFLTREGYLRKG